MFAARALNVTNEPLEQEFEELFHEHYPLVYRTAYSVTGTREDAEDVVRTIFLRLYRQKSWRSFKQQSEGLPLSRRGEYRDQCRSLTPAGTF